MVLLSKEKALRAGRHVDKKLEIGLVVFLETGFFHGQYD